MSHDSTGNFWHARDGTTTLQDRMQEVQPKAIILSGGPNSVHIEGAPTLPAGFFDWVEQKRIPVLGICYGTVVPNQ